MVGLEVHNLVKTLGDNVIDNDITFSVEDGEFFIVSEPSGSGKSTPCYTPKWTFTPTSPTVCPVPSDTYIREVICN